MLKKNTLILVGVFVVLLTVTLLIQRNRALNPPQPDAGLPTSPPPVYLFEFTSEALTGVQIENETGDIIELQKNSGGEWSIVQPPTLPDGTDQTSISSALAQIGTVRVLNELANPPGVEVIGLDTPTSTITFSLDSGEKMTIEIGDPSPTGNGYYIRLNGSAMKLVDKALIDRLIGFIAAPPLLPTPILTTTLELTPTLTIEPTP